MKQDIKVIKEILYRLEDITSLGVSLPLVAFQQLQIHLPKLDIDDNAMRRCYNEVRDFIEKHKEDYKDKDERAICRAFMRMKKKHPDRLDEYRLYHKRIEEIHKYFLSL